LFTKTFLAWLSSPRTAIVCVFAFRLLWLSCAPQKQPKTNHHRSSPPPAISPQPYTPSPTPLGVKFHAYMYLWVAVRAGLFVCVRERVRASPLAFLQLLLFSHFCLPCCCCLCLSLLVPCSLFYGFWPAQSPLTRLSAKKNRGKNRPDRKRARKKGVALKHPRQVKCKSPCRHFSAIAENGKCMWSRHCKRHKRYFNKSQYRRITCRRFDFRQDINVK